jgi:hypothetical protein
MERKRPLLFVDAIAEMRAAGPAAGGADLRGGSRGFGRAIKDRARAARHRRLRIRVMGFRYPPGGEWRPAMSPGAGGG